MNDNVILCSIGRIKLRDKVILPQRSYICIGSRHDFKKKTFESSVTNLDWGEFYMGGDRCLVHQLGIDQLYGARILDFKDIPPEVVCIGGCVKPVKHRILSNKI